MSRERGWTHELDDPLVVRFQTAQHEGQHQRLSALRHDHREILLRQVAVLPHVRAADGPIGSRENRREPARVRARRRHERGRPPRPHDAIGAGRKVEPSGCGDRRQEVGGPRELHAGELLHLERHDEVPGSARAAIANPGMKPVVPAGNRRLMHGAAVVGMADPEVGRVPEASAPRLGAGVRGIVAQPEVRRG